jgi:poly(3-hydroxybutyrate) depolymerase
MASSGLKLYGVETIRGKRKTPSGEERSYTLYVPKATDGLPKPPYPMVVLIHGFLMTGAQQATNAENLSERGFIVFTPNITKVLLGDRTRMDNVHDIIDHIKWLTGKDSPVAGIVDSNRVAIGGNSSGGAVILEIALEAQKMHVPIAAMCSLNFCLCVASHRSATNMRVCFRTCKN